MLVMNSTIILTDYILHVGPNGSTESCALLRMPNDEAITNGYLTVVPTANERYNLTISTGTKKICLADVHKRHIDIIRMQGLYIIQRTPSDSEPKAVLVGRPEL